MAVKVTSIPATKSMYSNREVSKKDKKKVAAYARVSTDFDEQFTSFEAQVNYYSSYIKSHEDWTFVKVYSDEGISGTSASKRPGFQSMIADALAGKIDLIITKSVSRFARNTVDTLSTIRNLKDHGIEVYFEKENIWTFDSKGELLITIMASLAQEESRSMSENIKWAVNRKFQSGRFSLPYNAFLGYDKGPDGMPVINEKEAETVRNIYNWFLSGYTIGEIRKKLNAAKIPTPRGFADWSLSSIRQILTNEKYTGNAILHKHYTSDFLTKKKCVNNGEVPKYYVEGSHEAIISQETFDLVQMELNKGKAAGQRQSIRSNVFAGKVVCADCGSPFTAKLWHSTDKYRRIVYQCYGKYNNREKFCRTGHFSEDELKTLALKAINRYLDNKDEVIGNLAMLSDTLYTTEELTRTYDRLYAEAGAAKELFYNSSSKGPLTDPAGLEFLQKRYDEAYRQLTETEKEIRRREEGKKNFNMVIDQLRNSEDQIQEYSMPLFNSLVEKMTVYSKSRVVVTFRCGTEIELGL